MAIQDKPSLPADAEVRRDAAKTIFAVGGLLAAFGVASCCALPIALSLLGIGAAWLLGIGVVAAQYQQQLFYGAVVLLLGAAFVMWRQRRALACSPGTTCTRPALDRASKIGMLLAVGLLALTFWIEPPV